MDQDYADDDANDDELYATVAAGGGAWQTSVPYLCRWRPWAAGI